MVIPSALQNIDPTVRYLKLFLPLALCVDETFSCFEGGTQFAKI